MSLTVRNTLATRLPPAQPNFCKQFSQMPSLPVLPRFIWKTTAVMTEEEKKLLDKSALMIAQKTKEGLL